MIRSQNGRDFNNVLIVTGLYTVLMSRGVAKSHIFEAGLWSRSMVQVQLTSNHITDHMTPFQSDNGRLPEDPPHKQQNGQRCRTAAAAARHVDVSYGEALSSDLIRCLTRACREP
jgi:hypothetical protein